MLDMSGDEKRVRDAAKRPEHGTIGWSDVEAFCFLLSFPCAFLSSLFLLLFEQYFSTLI
jgi:hypothetical protein